MSEAPPPEESSAPGPTATGAEPSSAPGPATEPPPPARFAYGAEREIELGASGFRAPRWPGRSEVFVAYRDITHVALEARVVSVGTASHGVLLLNTAKLGGEANAGALAEALRARVFALPNGDARRTRFERLDAKLTRRRPWIAAGLVVVTVAAYALQQLLPEFREAAVYRPPLLALGEWWRYATTQFLHVNAVHLGVNAVSALIAGAFVERSIGRAGTLFVAGAAGFGAMYASRWGAYGELLGFSGVAAGFFGALLAIEFLAPAEAPAPARIPRPVLLGVVVLQAAIDLNGALLPDWAAHSAGWAHLGGFLGGGLAALATRESARALVQVGAFATIAVASLSFGIVAKNLRDPSPALERQARKLLEGPAVDPVQLNNLAWQIVTSRNPSESVLSAAADLAEMAVALTSHREPTILDTLAEVYFAQGRAEDAVAVIDEAIALAPDESYYVEQRRRFTGERAADDRPAAPPEPAPPGSGAPDADGSREPGFEAPPGEVRLPPGDEITV